MTTLFPLAGFALMLLPMMFYNITGEKHRQMMKDIMARREAAYEAENKKTNKFDEIEL